MKLLSAVLVAAVAAVFLPATATPASALATTEDEWLTTVGNYCYNDPSADDGQTCNTKLITRTRFVSLPSYTVYISGTLDGPMGPIGVRPQYGSWDNRPPAEDYKGLSYNTTVYSDSFESLPPGDYTYTLSSNFPKQWHCSKFDANGCSYIGGENYNYTYRFTFDGVTPIVVAPQWEAKLTAAGYEKSLFGKAVDLYYLTNAPRGTRILIQRKQGSGKWKTVKKTTYPLYDFDEDSADFVSDMSRLKPGAYSYRLVFTTTGGDTISNVRKVRVR